MKKFIFLLTLSLMLISSTSLHAESAQTEQQFRTIDIGDTNFKAFYMGEQLQGISCSSRDGSQDCFCEGSCTRTETSCSCISSGIAIETTDPIKDSHSLKQGKALE